MQMSREDIRNFPKLHQYVSCKIPEVRDVQIIINTIQKRAGTITKATIKEALVWGKGPMLKVVDMAPLGEFTPDTSSNEIRLQKAMVRDFEAGKGLRKTAFGKLVFLVGVTILHELTHWADDQDGVDTPGEEGELFEKDVYGKVIV
jgi:Metallopeptidase toxin 3